MEEGREKLAAEGEVTSTTGSGSRNPEMELNAGLPKCCPP